MSGTAGRAWLRRGAGAATRARLGAVGRLGDRWPALYGWDARRELRALERAWAADCAADHVAGSLAGSERRWSSQNGEDGVIDELVRRVGAPGRWFVEIGASDGEENCTRHLAEAGWCGVWLEADPGRAALARERAAALPGAPGVQVVEAFARRSDISALLDRHGVPADPDVLVVDIDGDDRGVLAAVLAHRRPRIVVVEYNAAFRPPAAWSLPERRATGWDGTFRFGASLQALCDAAPDHELVHCDRSGVNAFLVRSDLVAAAGGARPPRDAHRRAAYARHPFGHVRSRAAVRPPAGLDLAAAQRLSLACLRREGGGAVQAGAPVGCSVEVVNDAAVPLSSGSPGGCNLVLRWAGGGPPAPDAPRTPLPHPVPPRSRRRVVLWLPAPTEPGRHVLEVTGVVEGVSWFDHGPAGPPQLTVEVGA